MVMTKASPLAVEFGRRVAARRKELRWTLRGLAAACKMGPTSIWQVEHGASMPGIDTALKIARALNVSVAWLIDGEAPPRRDALADLADRVEFLESRVDQLERTAG
jgi:transcriptional regulator with XRE-family HTH domain